MAPTSPARAEFLTRIDTGSTLADLPGYEAALEMSDRAKKAGDYFHAHREAPGLLLTEEGRFRAVLSRRYYHEIVGQYCGMDLYHPRPLRFMMERMEEHGGALTLPGDTPIELAVRQGLERPRALVYEPLAVNLANGGAPGKVRLIDFEDLLAADARVTLLRGEQMKQILATVREGLLLIDREQRIGLEYAGSAETILETRGLAGRALPEVLASCLDPERTQLAAEYLDLLFNPRVIESLIAKINPLLRVTGNFAGGRRKVLAFRFVRGFVGDAIRHVLVRIEDLTREDELARELEGHRRRGELHLELAVAAMQADPEAVVGLLDRLARQLRRTESILERPRAATPPAAFDPLLRDLHGAKGEAGFLGFAPLGREIHGLEGALAAYRDAEPEEEAARAEAREKIGSVDAILLATRSVLEQLARFGRTLPRESAEPRPAIGSSLETSIERWVSDLAAELGKPARFLWRLEGVELPERYAPLLRETLAQLVRNSLVHGIESAEVRRDRGKPAVATLQLAARPRPEADSIELIFQDDGAGLDLAALRAKAALLDLAAGSVMDSENELRRLIFRPGFSTADRTTLHAGRGVGLDLVRERIEAAGGRIAVHSEPGRYCAFQIRLPRQSVESRR
ncbi:MAG: ATP-binding protein [Acidobacteriota bacterium]